MHKKIDTKYVVALMCFIIAFFYLGYANNSSSLYVVPVTKHYGFNRAEFSMIFSIISIVGILANLAFSKMYKYFRIKKLIIFGAVLCASAYFVYYKSTTLMQFYTGAFLFGIGFSYINMLTISLLINSWFTEKKGTILGIVTAGSGFGGAVMSTIVGYIISVYGFKQSYLTTSIILFIIIIPIVLFIKENTVFEHIESEQEGKLNTKRKTIRQLLKEQSVILGFIVIFLMGFVIVPWLNISASHLMDRGFDEIFVSKILGGVLFIMAFSKILMGTIYDKFGIKTAISICLISFVLSAVLLLKVNSKLTAWMFAVFFGISASLSLLLPLFTSEIAGEEYLGDIIGISHALIGAGISIGTPLINFIYDLTGSNNLALVMFTILGTFNIILAFLALKKTETFTEMDFD